MTQPVALLDVDHTLLFDRSDELNMELLGSLLKHNVTRVYLFTDMTFSQHTIEERNSLMKQLEETGFSVQGAITPNDVTWAMMDSVEVGKLHDMCFQDGKYTGKLYGPDFEWFVLENKDVFPTLSKAIQCYDPTSSTPSEAYSDACLEHHSTGTVSDSTKMKSIFAKVFADHLSEKCGYKHNKGLLMDMFVRHKPDWVSSIIVFDDNASVIEDITDFRLFSASADGSVSSGSASTNSNTLPHVPISIVPVASSAHTIEYYDDLIAKHLQRIS